MKFWSTRKSSAASPQNIRKRIYLDYAAATPMSSRAKAAMLPFLDDVFGNPGGIHAEGVAAKRAVEDFRVMVARTLEVQPNDVVFTSGGTESNNLAIIGVIEQLYTSGRSYESMTILSTKLEHPATLRTLEKVATLGVRVVYMEVSNEGILSPATLAAHLDTTVVLVTLAYVNSEIGVITECRAVRRALDEAEKKFHTRIYFHVDAAQAPLWLPCTLSRIGADALSLDGGKCGGGKGIGALIRKHGVVFAPVLHGGGQEMGIRPGTEPVHLIAAFATALEEAQAEFAARAKTVTVVRDYCVREITRRIPSVVINGPVGSARVANNVHVSIPGIDVEFAVITLDTHGVAASTKSACSSKGGGASSVVLAMTGDNERATATLRFTLGPMTTTADIDYMLDVLTAHIAQIPQF